MSTSYSDRVLAALYDSTLAATSVSHTTRPTPLYIIASPRALCGVGFGLAAKLTCAVSSLTSGENFTATWLRSN